MARSRSVYSLSLVLPVRYCVTIIAVSHRQAQTAWALVMTLVLSLGGTTRTHVWCASALLSVQAGVIKPIN